MSTLYFFTVFLGVLPFVMALTAMALLVILVCFAVSDRRAERAAMAAEDQVACWKDKL